MRLHGKRRFADIDCEVSGTDSGDESDGHAEENDEDRNFIDDAPVEESDEGERIKIRRCELKISADDKNLVLENIGLRGRRRVAAGGGASTVYKDSDEDDADSDDDGFVVTDSDEEVGRRAGKLVRDYSLKQGESQNLNRICIDFCRERLFE
jgi:hypothetical protein